MGIGAIRELYLSSMIGIISSPSRGGGKHRITIEQ
jgi:hypothetical protein